MANSEKIQGIKGCNRNTIVDGVSGNDRTKSKISEVCRTLSEIRDRNMISGNIRKLMPCRLDTQKRAVRIRATSFSASFSEDPVLKSKYDATVVMRSLMETEDASDKYRI